MQGNYSMEIFNVNENIYSMVFHPGLTREYDICRVFILTKHIIIAVTLTLSENIYAMEIHLASMKE